MLARPYHKHTISKLHWDCTAILPYYNRMGTKTQSLRMLNSLCQEVHRPQLDKWWVRAAEVIATGKDREGSYPIKIPVVILLFQSVFSFCWVLLKWFRSRFEDPHGMRIICRSLKVSKHQILALFWLVHTLTTQKIWHSQSRAEVAGTFDHKRWQGNGFI